MDTNFDINTDLSRRVVLHPAQAHWRASPIPGVERRLLDRSGDEVARATSVVRYVPGSAFLEHRHGGGEEILVLDGVFSDETGDYPAGFYLRNPPGSQHAPFSRQGCTLLVKLWQFTEGDTARLCLDTRRRHWHQGLVPGLSIQRLHHHEGIDTALVRWAPGARFDAHTHPGGEESYVIEGLLGDEHGEYPAGTWVRNPRWSRHTPWAGPEGALVYMKIGHIGARFLPLP